MEPISGDRDLQTALAHVLWIGGAPDSGKTSIAKALGKRYGLHRYSLDDHAEDHWIDQLSKIPTAFGHTWMKMSIEEKWLGTSPETMASNTKRIEQEHIPFVVKDLLAAP